MLQHSPLKAGDEQNDGGQISEQIQNLTQKFLKTYVIKRTRNIQETISNAAMRRRQRRGA